jgi:hypothetical protein
MISSAVVFDDAEAKKKGKKKVKIAFTGQTYGVSTHVQDKAIREGMRVHIRTDEIFGIFRAEINLNKNYGDEDAQETAKAQIAYLEEDFFADVWVHTEENETSGWSTVTIRVGNEVRYYMFYTPGPMDTASKEFHARQIMEIINDMLP